jgi:hypothetical protein
MRMQLATPPAKKAPAVATAAALGSELRRSALNMSRFDLNVRFLTFVQTAIAATA